MSWSNLFVVLAILATGDTINKTVYKVALTQKGYAQFVQYDIDTPPLREFTFCVWVRFFHLDNDQTIFTYVANGNNRVVRLWLDTGGRHVKISIEDRVLSTIPVDMGRDVWRHICLSYQSDHGAWALYMDARLLSCEVAQRLQYRVLPGGGRIIVGYGIANNGIPNGLEGEIFGVSMILSSTIERNHTIKLHPKYKQKTFNKNKIIGNNKFEYVVLGDMKAEEFEQQETASELPAYSNASQNYIKLRTPYSLIEHDVGIALSPTKSQPVHISDEKEILDFSDTDKVRTTPSDPFNFWNIINEAGNIGKFKSNTKPEITVSGTQSYPMISEYETPPAPSAIFNYSEKSPSSTKLTSFSNIRANNIPSHDEMASKVLKVSDIETPPPLTENSKVYGQWTSSKFASSVLNYLKSINFNQREQKRIPPTIPLLKISDSFPYASDPKVSKVLPSFKFQRRNFVDKRLGIKKRAAKYPQINVQILQDDLRDQIIESHAQTRPKYVEVTNRGRSVKNKERRFYRNVRTQVSNEEPNSDEVREKPFIYSSTISDFKVKKLTNTNKNNLFTILPFLKSLEYYVDNFQENKNEKASNTYDMYSKSLSNANKWHNIKSYSNDYTPRQINIQDSSVQSGIQEKIVEVNKKLPSIRLNYKPDNQKVEAYYDDKIIHGRTLASEISNASNQNLDSLSLIKYNHGFLPSHHTNRNLSNNIDSSVKESKIRNNFTKNNFNKHVKLGNALNERNVIGHNVEQNKESFVGGDETVPDINKYRSDIDRETGSVPPSLGPRICKNVELYDRYYYVQLDGSIDVTHILSQVREKNIGIEFIMEHYKKCSLKNTALDSSPLLFIDWERTPVRMFGGAYTKKTTDLCGFF